MDANEVFDMVISMAKLRYKNSCAATDDEAADANNLEDSSGRQMYDNKATISDYDYRTDEVCALLKDSTERSYCCNSSLLFKY